MKKGAISWQTLNRSEAAVARSTTTMLRTESAPETTESVNRRPSILRRLARYLDVGLTYFFSFIASCVAQRPKLTILCCILLGLVLGAGMLRINVVTNVEELFTPQDSAGFDDRDYVEALYGYGQSYVDIYTTATNRNRSSVLNQASLLAQLDLWNKVNTVQVTYNGSSFTLTDPEAVCYRPGGEGTPCDIVSVLDYWGYSRDAILGDSDLGATVSNQSAVDQLGRPLSPSRLMGAIVRDASGQIQSVGAFQMIIVLQNNQRSGSTDKKDSWQKAAVPLIREYDSENAEFFINSDWAVDQEADKTVTDDVVLLIIGYCLLLVYGMIVLGKPHPVESSSHLALANIASIGLAVLATYGLVILVGVNFSLVVQLLALLLLGLGTDDMLVTMTAHEETAREMPNASVVERIVGTVSRARRGVAVAAITNFVAFCTGTASSLPAVKDFMTFAAVGVIMVLIFQSTFYVACLTLDMRRQRAKKLDTLCCVTSSAGSTDGCCGRTYDPERPKISQRIIGIWLPKIILHPIGKVAVIAVTAFLLTMGVIGAINVEQNFDYEWFIPSGSWIKEVLEVRDEYFSQFSGKGAIPFDVYTKNLADPPLDYFLYQDELYALSVNLQKDRYVSAVPPVDSWYISYITWLSTTMYATNLTSQGRPSTSELFYTSLREYLSTDGRRYEPYIIFSNTSTNIILSSKITAYFISLTNAIKQVNAMNSVRKVARESAPSLNAIAYTYFFHFYEGFAVIQWDTIQEVIIAGSSVFIICLIMLADLISAVCVGFMVVFIDIELVGFLHWAGLSFNSVTSISILLAVGIAVDYSAFTAFSFMTKVGTRNERARQALAHFGVAVFNGGFTLFLAVLPAAAAQSFIFQTFFKMFSMIVALGLWHGLFALPVLLSLIGSDPYDSAFERMERIHAKRDQEVVQPLEDVVTDAPKQGAMG